MERHGLVAISRRSTMRQRFVTLSSKGSQALAKSLSLWRETQRSFVGHVGEQYWESMRRQLEKMPNVALDLEKASRV